MGRDSKGTTYTQVLLNRKVGGQWEKMTAWVPSNYAKVGETLVVEDNDWQVVETYAIMSAATIKKYPKDFKRVLDL